MNELLNPVNLPGLGVESPPGMTPKEGLKDGLIPGTEGFAALLSQFGLAIPSLVCPEMTDNATPQGNVGPALQAAMAPILLATPTQLQLLNSVDLTGQQQAMDGSSTGSLPINAQQGFDLMSLNLGASPVETLTTARQLLASAIPASTDPQLLVVSEQQPSGSVASLNGAEFRLPADLMLSNGDLAKLQSILSQVPLTSPQSAAIQPNLSLETSAKSLTTPPEVKSQLGGLEQLLKEQFPTLNIKDLSAQLHLKSPELVKTVADAAPNVLPKALPTIPLSDGLSTELSPAQKQFVDAILTQPMQQNRPQANGLAEILPTMVSPDPNASLTTAASSSVVTQPAVTVVAAQTTVSTEVKPNSDLTITPETIKKVQEGSLEKTAVKSAEGASDYSQTAQQLSKLTSDQSDPPFIKHVVATPEPQIDKTKFKIQFDRFQIDALLQRSEIKLQLHPASLGSMRVKLISTSQEVTARFETTSEVARTAVEQNLPQLRESLDKAGIKVDHVEVVLDEQRARQQQSHNHSQRRHQSDTDIVDNATQQELSRSGSGFGTTVQSMLGGLNLLA